MLAKLILIFILVPMIEVILLVRLGTWIGFWPTILIQIITGALGATLARIQGLYVWTRIQLELAKARIPAEEMIDGLLIFLAGIVLLTPGLITDTLGFLILIPWTRNAFKGWLRKKFDHMARTRHANVRYILEGDGKGG